MLKKIAFAVVGLSLLASPLIASAQIVLPTDCSATPTIACLQTEIQELVQILTQLLAARHPSTQPSATIDQSSLSASTGGKDAALVTITGEASKVREVTVGLKVGNSSNALVTNGLWSATIPSVFPGLYSVEVTDNDSGSNNGMVLATGTLTVSSAPTPLAQPDTLTVSTDASSPAYEIVAGGQTGVVLGVFDLNVFGSEPLLLNKLGLTLTSGQGSDLQDVTVWIGGTQGPTQQVGTAVFTGTSNSAVITLPNLSLTASIPGSEATQIFIKGDIGAIGVAQPATAGDLIQVNIDPTRTSGFGSNSGLSVTATGNTSVAGVRIFKSYPTVALIPLPSTGLNDGRLLRFSVTASPAGSIGLAEIGLNLVGLAPNTNGQADLCAFTDAGYSQPISGFTAGCINGFPLPSGVTGGTLNFPQAVEIPAGATYYFELHDSTKGTGLLNESSLTTTVFGQPQYQGLSAISALQSGGSGMAVYFLWSPNDAGTASPLNDDDWTSGYSVAGLPASGISQTRTGSGTTPPPPSNCPVYTAPAQCPVGTHKSGVTTYDANNCPIPPSVCVPNTAPNPINTACPVNYLNNGICSFGHVLGVHTVSGLSATFFSFVRPGLVYTVNFGDGTEEQVPTCTLQLSGQPSSCNDAGYFTHTYTAAGTYKVSVIDYTCASGSTSCNLIIDSTSVTVQAQTSSATTPNANLANALTALESALKAYIGQ